MLKSLATPLKVKTFIGPCHTKIFLSHLSQGLKVGYCDIGLLLSSVLRHL